MDPIVVREPIYQQVYHQLRDRITAGAFAPGDQFLTERELADEFRISRATANKVLSALVSEGWLEFRKGKGTFVRAPRLDTDLRRLESFTERVRLAGRVPRTVVTRFERIYGRDLPPTAAEAFTPPPDEGFFAVERVRYADDQPMILEERWIPTSHCPELTAEELTGSWYEILLHHYELTITSVEERIRAISLTPPQAGHLQAEVGSPALLIVGVGAMEEEPLWAEETIYRGDQYEFLNRLGRFSDGSGPLGVVIRRL